MICLIWAMTKEFVIGKNNQIPWHIKEDLIYYKNHTKGKPVLMGEATYFSLKGYYKTKPLPYGDIYVASLNESLVLEDAVIVHDVEEFLKKRTEDLWVVGGATIYRLSLPYADRLYISVVKKNYEGDTYFPEVDFTKFQMIWKEDKEEVIYTLFERVVQL